MRAVALPEVPYGATAVRPDWNQLPAAVRAAVSARLGAPVTSATSAGGGFTAAFAAVLTTVDGHRAFVKAVPQDHPTAPWYAREAAVTAALPAPVRAARPRWTMAEAGYFVLCLDAVAGTVPPLPWRPDDLGAALAAWSAAATALAQPSDAMLGLGIPRLTDLVRDELSWWSEIAAGREPMPAVPPWVPARLSDLVALEQALPAHAGGLGMLHGDLRVDNIIIDADRTAWLCDWTWPCLGAPWFDTVTLLVSAYASGLDADAHLTPWGAPAEGVDGALAAMAGYWLVQAGAVDGGSPPHSRQHHRFSGRQALAWLAERRGWTAPAA